MYKPKLIMARLSSLGVPGAPPYFSRSLNHISTRGADYAYQIILAPPDFQTFRWPWMARIHFQLSMTYDFHSPILNSLDSDYLLLSELLTFKYATELCFFLSSIYFFAKVKIVKTTHESKGAKDPLRSQAGLPEYFCIRLVVNFRWPPVEVASPFFSSPQHAP